ncbi:MAG: DUF1849 family protein [Alphaproteobacteria bacterium]|nr:DUF1849 family protein [Alphaproteobacteria bacterium]
MRFVLAVAAALVSAGVGTATAVNLQPHLGIYELRLQTARPGANVTDVTGRLVIEVTDSCDGVAQTQRMLLKMTGNDGRDVTSDANHTTWESRDGQTIRFQVKNIVDGEIDEEYAGRADLAAKGQGGKITFTKPDLQPIPLQAGTVFPTEHFIDLINAGITGQRVLDRRVYDGSGPEGIFDAAAVLSAPGETTDADVAAQLAKERAWRVRVAYFGVGEEAASKRASGVPEYEVGFRLHENGIATDIVLDYGTFVLRGAMKRLEYLPGKC